jgi:hypothetical protein
LKNAIAYVALNIFGSGEMAKKFDAHFDEVLYSKGLILDPRQQRRLPRNRTIRLFHKLAHSG